MTRTANLPNEVIELISATVVLATITWGLSMVGQSVTYSPAMSSGASGFEQGLEAALVLLGIAAIGILSYVLSTLDNR